MNANIGWMQKRVRDGVSNRLRTFAGGRWAAYCRPTWISFLLTERCNSRCIHCNIWNNRGQEDSPSVEQWKDALTGIRKWLGPAHICLTGGEALLKPYAVDLVRHGASQGLFIELLTHGYWKDQQRIEELALSQPWRVTLSLDGLGDTHDHVRGREGFFERTNRTIETLIRCRAENRLSYSIRLKTVVMSHNLGCLDDLARYAARDGVDILYQPIERNYNTPDDPEWYQKSANWPTDAEQAVAAVQELKRLKQEGLPIANTMEELDVMMCYFRDPEAWQVSVQDHTANDGKAICAALGLIQVQADGGVRFCSSMPTVGNIKTASLREIWEKRPHWWKSGCCLERRMAMVERSRTT